MLAIAKAAAAAGFDVLVACEAGGGISSALAAAGIRTVGVDFAVGHLVSLVRELRALCAAEMPDIIQGTGFFTNNLARVAGQLARVPLIISTVHCEPDAGYLASSRSLVSRVKGLGRALTDRATGMVGDLVITVSENGGRKLALAGVPERKIVVIHNGIDIEDTLTLAARPVPLTGEVARHDGPLVGVIGRLEAVKDIETFIRAAELVAKRRPDVTAVVAGSGSGEKPLRRMVADKGLDERVVFTGWLEPERALPLLAKLDVYVLSSLSEGLNTSLVEALALERPVVATAVGGNPEVIIDGKTGLLVPAKDPSAMAAAILKLLDDTELARRLAEQGRLHVKANFTLEEMCRKTVELYGRTAIQPRTESREP